MGNLFIRHKNFETVLSEIKFASKGSYIIGVDEPNIGAFLGVNGVRGEYETLPSPGYKLNPEFQNLPVNKEELIYNKEIEGFNNLVIIHRKYKNGEITSEIAQELGKNEVKIVDDYKWELNPPKYVKNYC